MPLTEITITWSAEDVTDTFHAEYGGTAYEPLTEDEVSQVLICLKRNHDCDLGIHWETVRCAIEIVLDERYRKKALDSNLKVCYL